MLNRRIIEELKVKQKRLETVIRNAERELKGAPEGSVLVKSYKKGAQFYYRENPNDRNGKYMPVSDQKRAVLLMQKAYDRKALAAAQRQKSALDSFLKKYDPQALSNVFDRESLIRQGHLRPFELPDAQYAKAWRLAAYEGKPFRDDMPVHYTEKQERVRSKSEVLIANALIRAGIPYRYECPLNLSEQVIHPDFTILRMRDRREVYWEHLGMMDDAEYRNQAFLRIRAYEESGIFPGDGLILTVETGRLPLNAVIIQRIIGQYLL